jgi:SRSO17 transposase
MLLVMPLTPEGTPARAAPLTARRLATELPPSAWRRIAWAKGTKGPLVMDLARVRVEVYHTRGYHTTPGPSGEVGWLLFERRPNETKSYLLWDLDSLSIRQQARVMRARWPIEQGYQQMKEELGLDHFEGRTWTGWHHHVTMVSIAHAFLMTVRTEGADRALGAKLPTLPRVRKWIRAQMDLPIVRTISETEDEALRKRLLDRYLALTDSSIRLRKGRWWAPTLRQTVRGSA